MKKNRNPIANDLGSNKYRQRIIDKLRREDDDWKADLDDYWLEKEMGITAKE